MIEFKDGDRVEIDSSKEFKLALQEAELLKALPHGGIVARQFLLLVEENKKVKAELKALSDEFQGYQLV